MHGWWTVVVTKTGVRLLGWLGRLRGDPRPSKVHRLLLRSDDIEAIKCSGCGWRDSWGVEDVLEGRASATVFGLAAVVSHAGYLFAHPEEK